jgi:hypothetical protein
MPDDCLDDTFDGHGYHDDTSPDNDGEQRQTPAPAVHAPPWVKSPHETQILHSERRFYFSQSALLGSWRRVKPALHNSYGI